MSRRRARRVAVEVLYGADVRGIPLAAAFEDRLAEEPDVPDYAERLLRGVDERRHEVDALITGTARGWPLERMSLVDRNVLRVGVIELLQAAAPPAVVIDEAVELAKRFSGEGGGRFVHGVLAAVQRKLTEDATEPSER